MHWFFFFDVDERRMEGRPLRSNELFLCRTSAPQYLELEGSSRATRRKGDRGERSAKASEVAPRKR